MKKSYLILLLYSFSYTVNSQKIIQTLSFKSANPFSFYDIITNLKNQEEQEVKGILTIPVNGTDSLKKYPLVIGVAGSLGWKDHHYEYLKMYQEMGIATFELNSFKSRNIVSTVGSQTEVTTAAMVLDAYRALELLSNHPNIDKNNVINRVFFMLFLNLL